MSGFALTPHAAPDCGSHCRLDFSALLPSRLAGQTAAAVAHLSLAPRVVVGDLFAVRATAAAALVIEGGSDRYDRVGAGLDGGEVIVRGAVGRQAGQAMRAGRLVLGEAGAGLAEEMRGGTVLVQGTVGEAAAARMRRGLLIVEGDAGPALAARMIAGTVLVCGTAARRTGLMMRRGTLRLGRLAGTLPPTFVPAAGAPAGVFEALLVRFVAPLSAAAAALCAAPSTRFLGDAAVGGQGEVLVAC
jgi:formylmethanofuran dehydrogenase subunit C